MSNISQVSSQESRSITAVQHLQETFLPGPGQEEGTDLVIEVLAAPSSRPAVFSLCLASNLPS
ncbi:hypothetical protein [Streptomyces boninensis]|uniref:hypothetical protein n=1 Tax=Streptomyces boninensis TaxID=2039455 RepID=UPI003B213ECD